MFYMIVFFRQNFSIFSAFYYKLGKNHFSATKRREQKFAKLAQKRVDIPILIVNYFGI